MVHCHISGVSSVTCSANACNRIQADIGNSLQVSNRRSDAAGHDSRIAGLGLAMLLEVEELKVRSIPRVGRTARGEATRKQAGNHDTRGRTSSSFRAEEGDVSGTHDVS